MDVSFFDQIRMNSRKFELLLEKVKESVNAESVFGGEVEKLRVYLEGLGVEKGLVKTIVNQLGHHGFKKFFLGYNSYKIFHKNKAEMPRHVIDVLCLGELFSIPIIFMDDVLDSHHSRNGKPTPYDYLSRKYPGREKEYTLFYSNIMLNYFIGELISGKISQSQKEGLLKIYVDCSNRTFLSPTYEHKAVPKKFDEVLGIYRGKSYYFTTRFVSELGSSLAGGNIERGGLLEKTLLGLTYLVSIKNDIFDFFGSGRIAMEDTLNHSNTFGLYLLRRSLGSRGDASKLLEEKDKTAILRILVSPESRKEMMKRSLQLRNSIGSMVRKHKGRNRAWFQNYQLYADFLLKDLLDNLKHVQ